MRKSLWVIVSVVLFFAVIGCSGTSKTHRMRGPTRRIMSPPPTARHMPPPEFRHNPRLGQRDQFHNKSNKFHKSGKFDGKREFHGRKHFKNVPAEKPKNFKNSRSSHFSRQK